MCSALILREQIHVLTSKIVGYLTPISGELIRPETGLSSETVVLTSEAVGGADHLSLRRNRRGVPSLNFLSPHFCRECGRGFESYLAHLTFSLLATLHYRRRSALAISNRRIGNSSLTPSKYSPGESPRITSSSSTLSESQYS
jgi:hypothetical protein